MLTKDEIVAGLGRLAELLRERHTEGEICLFGGAVMVLAFQARPSTKDVDAIFQPAPLVRTLARQVAVERDLPEDWLNDGKGFVSARHEAGTEDLPQFDGLRVTAPTPEYLLAMKCMASRRGPGPTIASSGGRGLPGRVPPCARRCWPKVPPHSGSAICS